MDRRNAAFAVKSKFLEMARVATLRDQILEEATAVQQNEGTVKAVEVALDANIHLGLPETETLYIINKLYQQYVLPVEKFKQVKTFYSAMCR